LGISEILKDSTDVHDLFSALACSHIFILRSWKSDGILSTWPPADWSTIEHEDKTGMRSVGIGVTGPISIDPTPEEIDVCTTTAEENALFIRTAKIPKNVVDPWGL
jgi:hypothetical protein